MDSYTKESKVDKDVGPGYDSDDYDKCSDIESNNKSDNGTLSRKILHMFKHQ